MQTHHKSQLTQEALRTFLDRCWPESVTKLEKLVEGENSQALYFESDNKRYVIRINKADYGFRKDAHAYKRFASEAVPIPRVFQIGQVDNEHA